MIHEFTLDELAKIAHGLDPNAKRRGNGYSVRCCCHTDHNPSLSINLSDEGKLLIRCFADCSFEEIFKEIKSRGLLPEYFYEKARYKGTEYAKNGYIIDVDPVPQAVPCDENQGTRVQKNITDGEKWNEIWEEGVVIENTPAEFYLRNRGINTRIFLDNPCLRYHAKLYHSETNTNLPALISLAVNYNNKPVSILRTYITTDGKKAFGQKSKMLFGKIEGGFIWINKRDSNKVIITEGLEDALVLAQCCMDYNIMAAVGGNITAIKLPDDIQEVIIFADQDDVGKKNARTLKRKLQHEGRGVAICYPPEGFKDANEYFTNHKNPEYIQAIVEQSIPEFHGQLMQMIPAQEAFARKVKPNEFLINQILPEIGLAIVAGDPKVGKSWLVLNMIVAIVSNQPLLNDESFSTKKVNIAYLALEDNIQRLKTRWELLTNNMSPDGLYLQTLAAPLDQEGLNSIKGTLSKHPSIKMLVIDPYQKIRPRGKNEGDAYQKDYADIGLLKELAEEHEILILLVLHLKKSKTGSQVCDINGSMGLAGAADVLISLEQNAKENARCSHILKITGKDVEEQTLNLDSDEHWNFSIAELQHENENNLDNQILRALENQQQPLKPTDLYMALNKTTSSEKTSIRKRLKILVDKDKIIKVSKGFYQLKGQNSNQTIPGYSYGIGEGTGSNLTPEASAGESVLLYPDSVEHEKGVL